MKNFVSLNTISCIKDIPDNYFSRGDSSSVCTLSCANQFSKRGISIRFLRYLLTVEANYRMARISEV